MGTNPIPRHNESQTGTLGAYAPERTIACPCGGVMASRFGVFVCRKCHECVVDSAPYVECVAPTPPPVVLDITLEPTLMERIYRWMSVPLKIVGYSVVVCVAFFVTYAVYAAFSPKLLSGSLFDAIVVVSLGLGSSFLAMMYLRFLISKDI